MLLLALLFPIQTHSTANSTKKGLGFGASNFFCGDVEAFNNLIWYYNWRTEFYPECGPQPKPGNFIPMIWGYWGDIKDIHAEPYDTILGFNEPNHKDQSNLSPEEAAFAWIELQEKYPEKKLVSPCASAPNTTLWFDEFFDICKELGCRIDYLSTHSYTCNAERDLEFMNELYERFVIPYYQRIYIFELKKSRGFFMNHFMQPLFLFLDMALEYGLQNSRDRIQEILM